MSHASPTTLRLADLTGRWFIQQSNFPMWLKGDKQHPTFDYVVEERSDGPVLIDTVGYEKRGATTPSAASTRRCLAPRRSCGAAPACCRC